MTDWIGQIGENSALFDNKDGLIRKKPSHRSYNLDTNKKHIILTRPNFGIIRPVL